VMGFVFVLSGNIVLGSGYMHDFLLLRKAAFGSIEVNSFIIIKFLM
jgi:hypothetical protein